MTQAMRDAWAEALCEVAAGNDDLVVLDGDLGTSTRADRFAAAYPERFLQMGIAEQNMVGAAVGLASLGFVPWVSSFAVFLTHRAADPVRMLVAQTRANVKIGAAYSGLLTGRTGKTHQDVEDLAIMRAMPGMTRPRPRRRDRMQGDGPLGQRDDGTRLPPPRPGRRPRPRGAGLPVHPRACAADPRRDGRPARVDRDANGAVCRRSRSAGGERDLGRRGPRPVDQAGRRCGDRRGRRRRAPRGHRRGAFGPRRPRGTRRRDRRCRLAAPGAPGSGSRTRGASRRRTSSCSSDTACRPSGSRSAW